MTGIFGCGSKNHDCKILGSTLEENMDISRGVLSNLYSSSDICIGIQGATFSGESNCLFRNEDGLFLAFLSDFPRTTSDTFVDVVKDFYSKEGADGLIKALIQGSCDDFLLLLYDDRKKQLFIMGDPFGIRKIFYAKTSIGFFFSSCLNQLIQTGRILNFLPKTLEDDELDIEALVAYLLHGSIPPKRTIFRRIQKTFPGSILEFHEQGKLAERPLWPPSFSKQTDLAGSDPENDYSMIVNAVKERIDKNLTTGLLISGGLDSGVIASLLSRITRYQEIIAVTLGYEGYYDESSAAQEIADFLGLRLVKEMVPKDDDYLLQMFEESISLMEEPSARTSYMSRYIAFKAIKKHSDTVWLGEGGDEVFVGYTPITWKYDDNPLIKFLSVFPPEILKRIANTVALCRSKSEYADIIRSANLAKKERLLLKLVAESTSTSRTVQAISGFKFDSESLLRDMYYGPLGTTFKRSKSLDKISRESLLLLSVLAQSDVMIDESYSSRLNLKLKLPFLDQELVKMFLRKPANEKLVGGTTKYCLRQMAISFDLLPKRTILGQKSWFLNPTFFIEGEQLVKHIMEKARFLANSTRSRFVSRVASAVRNRIFKEKASRYVNAITLIEFLSRYA